MRFGGIVTIANRMDTAASSVPPTDHRPGLCECGCGEKTRLAPYTAAKQGWIKGEPLRFVKGHSARVTNRTRRLTSKIEVLEQDCGYPTPCHIWQGSVGSHGYGAVGDGQGRVLTTHRRAWEAQYGPIPRGLHLHHWCGQRRCVNPDHMALTCQAAHVRHEWAIGTYDETIAARRLAQQSLLSEASP